MSILQLTTRPLAVFDAANPAHRQEYYKFLTTGTWGNCPIQFIVDSAYTNMVDMIQHQMLDYYANQEFGSKSKKRVVVDKRATRLSKLIAENLTGRWTKGLTPSQKVL